ncbi:threonine ammonia-lyase [Acidicapsa ligni]|uniref:threonine ammonia-lyase n=1 Tax=Acidicapsa ligni TaxID=542300 RepID=UPI0021DF55F6|nr:threonine ammonia-lyase [Acidicapsa ligni]
MEPVTLSSIQDARTRIGDAIHFSPCQLSHHLSERIGIPLYLKLENLQRTGSFKERGALNKLLTLTEEERRRGVIAASAGNHAQGVAYHSARLGLRAQIVMPQATPLVKVVSTRGFGAEVILHGANYDEACEEALRRCAEQGLTFIHPFDDPVVISGQGTIGLELLDQVPDLEAVVVPIGGGGLISGIACALKESNPRIRVIGVEPEKLPSMLRAREAGHPITLSPEATIADGIAVRRAGDVTLPLVSRYVDEIVTVDDEEIASAILMLLEQEKTLAEGAGAAALASLLQAKTNLKNRKTAVLVCGGNIDVTLLSKIIERGLVKDGRLLRIRVYLLDRPGALLNLTQILANERANIVETIHNRAYYGVSLSETVIDVTLETRGATHITAISHALREAGFHIERIQ